MNQEEKAKEILAVAEAKAREMIALAEERAERHHKERLDEMEKTINFSIQKYVNGKIDNQTEILNKFVQSFYEASKTQVETSRKIEKKFEDYYIQDMEWKKTANPAVTLVNNTTTWSEWIGVHIVKLAKLVILIGATIVAWTGIANYFK